MNPNFRGNDIRVNNTPLDEYIRGVIAKGGLPNQEATASTADFELLKSTVKETASLGPKIVAMEATLAALKEMVTKTDKRIDELKPKRGVDQATLDSQMNALKSDIDALKKAMPSEPKKAEKTEKKAESKESKAESKESKAESKESKAESKKEVTIN